MLKQDLPSFNFNEMIEHCRINKTFTIHQDLSSANEIVLLFFKLKQLDSHN